MLQCTKTIVNILNFRKKKQQMNSVKIIQTTLNIWKFL